MSQPGEGLQPERPRAIEADEADLLFATNALFRCPTLSQNFLTTCSPSGITSEFPQLSIHILWPVREMNKMCSSPTDMG